MTATMSMTAPAVLGAVFTDAHELQQCAAVILVLSVLAVLVVLSVLSVLCNVAIVSQSWQVAPCRTAA